MDKYSRPNKAATLLGLLSELSQQIPEEISPDLLKQYRNIGVRRMDGERKVTSAE